MTDRPPLGVIPSRYWKRRRAQELLSAIGRYVEVQSYGPTIEWSAELHNLLIELKFARDKVGDM